MATYAIGDIQGCFRSLQRLLRRIDFSSNRDHLWLTGDLINRGPHSLETLRWARHCPNVTAILGNHELHLWAVAAGLRQLKGKDTLQPILDAPDRADLLSWIETRPLLFHQAPWTMVHAGLHPHWTLDQAQAEAAHALESLQQQPTAVLPLLRHQDTLCWKPELPSLLRAAAALRVLVTLRVCKPGGTLHATFNGPPGDTPEGYVPWFELPYRARGSTRVVFGHWAALDGWQSPHAIGLDTGCVWGRTLSAYRLDDGVWFKEPAGSAP